MKVEIKVPPMGESISEATIGAIFKSTGSLVAMDDELLELETDKVNQALFAAQPGIVILSVKAGDKVSIGQVIGHIDTDSTAHPPATGAMREEKKAPVPALPLASTPVRESSVPFQDIAKKSDEGIRYSKEQFLEEVRIAEDKQHVVKKPPVIAADKSSPSPKVETRRRMTTIRRVIAERLVEAKNKTAMLTTFNEVDLTEVIALREQYKELFIKKHGVRLGFISFFLKAVVSALQAFPDLNSYIDGDEIVHREYYDIGVAVATDRGLMVPVIRGCDGLSFAAIEQTLERYATAAREGTLAISDLQGGGFTITNGGVYGSLLSTPILNPPQSAILGMHAIQKRPVVHNDVIAIRPMMYLALSYDHRIVDGKEAVTFLIHIKNALEVPARLMLDI